MAQVLQRVCNRCGTDFNVGGNWVKNADGVSCHTCLDGMIGEVVDVDLIHEKRPNLADMANDEAKIKAAQGVLAAWEKRGFRVEMHETDEIPPRFICVIGMGGPMPKSQREMLKVNPFVLLDEPPEASDAEILLSLEEPLRCVLAARGELCRAADVKKKGAGSQSGSNSEVRPEQDGLAGGESKGEAPDQAATGHREATGRRRRKASTAKDGAGTSSGGGVPAPTRIIDLEAKPRYAALGYAGVKEAVQGTGTIPPITKCPSCQGTMVFRFWEQPLLLSDVADAVEVQIIYHCSVCNRDDLYGPPIPTNNSSHPNHQMHPHLATCWPDADYTPNKFRSPNKQIILTPAVNEDEELDIDEDDMEEYVNMLKSEDELND